MDSNNIGDSNNSIVAGGGYSGSQYNSPLGTDGNPQPEYSGSQYNNPPVSENTTVNQPTFTQENYNQPVFDQPQFDQSVFKQDMDGIGPGVNREQEEQYYGGAANSNVPPFIDANGNQYYSEPQYYSPESDSKPVLILIFGILSIVCCFPFGIAAIVMYNSGKDYFSPDKKGLAIAGFICGIVGVSINGLMLLLTLLGSILTIAGY